MRLPFVRLCRLSFGLLIFFTVFFQSFTFQNNLINYFSYFTILCNLFIAFTFIFLNDYKYFDQFRGAATLFSLLTGLSFVFLLGGKNDELINWVSFILHYLSPFLVTVDWIIIPSKRISFKKSLIWIVFLFIYLAYSLIRGQIISWYPYDFLDPKSNGFIGLLFYVGIFFIATLVLDFIVLSLSGRPKSED